LIKAVIPDQLLAEWFTKSLLPPISRDVAMGGVVTEEEAISRAQYLDLVYSQSGTLYELIPNATCAKTIHLNLHPHHMRMELLVPSKLNLHPSRLELHLDLLPHLLLVRPHPPLPPLILKFLR
jgi:hypothetical protein